MESIEQPAVLAMPFANNGTKNTIPSAATGTGAASLTEGFPPLTSTSITDNGIPPSRADMNGLGYVSTAYAYLMQCGGVYTYRNDVASSIGGYPLNALLWYIPTNGIPNLLRSTVVNNTNNFNEDSSVIGEEGSGKPWEIVTVTPTNFVTTNTAQTISGAKTFSSSPLVPTATTGDSSTKAASTAFVANVASGLQTQINQKINTSDAVNLTGAQTITGAKTFSSGVTFANGSWNAVGDDVYFGDANVSGGFCIKGNNASSRIVLFDRNSSYSNGFYIDELDGNALKLNNTIYGAERWGSVTAMSSQSLSSNGYVKYNNGLIIQWGYSSVDNDQVTLPTPFSNTNYRVCATYMNTSSIGSSYGHVVTYPTSTTSFYANTEAGTYQWIAIGY